MKITVARQELLDKLSNIQNIVEKRNTMPILSHFLLEIKKEGSYILATDLETAIKEPINLSAEKDGRLCMPARKLFEIVKEIEGDVVIDYDEAQWVRVKAGKSSFRLACLSPDEFPAWPPLEDSDEIQISTQDIVEMIDKTIYSAGESDTRFTLNGLLFHIQPEFNTFTVVGTDGHRMAVMTKTLTSGVTGEKKVIVPRKAASELRKFIQAEGTISILIGKNHILFKINGIEFLARLIEGTYPNYVQVIPVNNQKRVVAVREDFVKALRRVYIMSRDRSNAVRVDFSAGSMTLTSTNPDLGEATDEFAVEYGGEALTTGFNARYLLDVLNAMPSEKVAFELQDPLSPTVLKKENSEDYKCVVMPMRI